MAFIGIDLGTTYSCVAGAKNKDGNIEIIANDDGNRLTPSCVTFTDKASLLGEEAIHQLFEYPNSTIYGIKRIIGRNFNDPAVQNQLKRWEFEVVNCHGIPKIRLNRQSIASGISCGKGNERRKIKDLHLEEISAKVLSHMKKIAEQYLGEPVKSAVITVPAYFNNAQRSATKDAAKIAGLNVLSLINEPTAAAIAYGAQQKIDSPRTVLIFDLGGGTFDVTLMDISKKSFDVKATAGDSHLGGEDFNSALFDHFVEEFKKANEGKDLTTSSRAKLRLFEKCEKLKKLLSKDGVYKQSVYIVALFDGIDFKTQISRVTFEWLNKQLFERTIHLVRQVLEDGGKEKTQVDEVVLVGGSTRIPCIKKMLSDYFGEEKLRKTIHPDEAVALGAANHAAELCQNGTSQRLRDVTPLSLGTAVKGGKMSEIIKRNTKIPAKVSRQYKTTLDNQSLISFKVYEGVSEKCSENNLLALLSISPLPPKPAGGVRIDVIYEIDSSGILHVSAIEEDSGIAHSTTIKMDGGRMSEEEINALIEKADKHRQEDKEWVNMAKHDYESSRGDARLPVVGIDLGIQNSYVAIAYGKEELVQMVEDAQHNTMIPSYVDFAKGGPFFGYVAKHQFGLDPSNTILGLKRIIGKRFKDCVVKEELKKCKFQVVDQDGGVKIKIPEGNFGTTYSAEKICSMVMKHLKETAENFIKDDIQHAVLTVPAYFTDRQRDALKSAAEQSGLEVLAVIKEPVAAAIAHGLRMATESSLNIMTFHLEEDTFNLAILNATDGVFVVKETTGDIHLGGVSFTERVFEHFADEFQTMHGEDLRNSRSAKKKLMEAVEKLLTYIRGTNTASLRIDSILNEREMRCILSGATFKSMNQDLLDRMLSFVRQKLDDAKTDKSKIHSVLLTGRYAFIYGIEEMLKNFFGHEKVRTSTFPGNTVATGAAMYASSLIGK